MKLEDYKVGMIVKGRNVWDLDYIITEIGARTITVTHISGNFVMRGGVLQPEVHEYKNKRPSLFTPAVIQLAQ